MPDNEVGDMNCDNSINSTVLIIETVYMLIIILKEVNVNNLVQFFDDILKTYKISLKK